MQKRRLIQKNTQYRTYGKVSAMLAVVFFAVCFFSVFFCSCKAPENDFTLSDFFGADIYVRADFSAASASEFASVKKTAAAICEKYKSSYSLNDSESAVCRYNAALPGDKVVLSEEEYGVFRKVNALYEKSGGAFNPAVCTLTDLWCFSSRFDGVSDIVKPYDRAKDKDGSYPLPDEKYVQGFTALAEFSGFELKYENGEYGVVKSSVSVEIDGAVYYQDIDFSGMIKGAAADEIFGCVSAVFPDCYVNVGSSSLSLGTHEGGNYTLGIVDPFKTLREDFIAFSVKNKSVSTSGTYEKYYIADGVYCHHIIDPKTGVPSAGGIKSATLAGEDGAALDAYTTAICAMSVKDAVAFVNSLENTTAVLVCDVENERFFLTNMKADEYTLKYAMPQKGICENGKIIYE